MSGVRPPLLITALALVLATLLALAHPLASSAASSSARPTVLVMTLDKEIDPITEEFVKRSISKARHDKDSALVIEMDTPGGDEDSMKGIIQAIIAADHLPVIVYVSPGGGRAASAGSIITYASDYAAMAPETNIGAATPINSDGQNVGSDLRRKVINDAVALVQGLAQTHHRNATFAKAMIVTGSSATAQAALSGHVVEYIGGSLTDVLDHANGFVTSPKDLTLNTANARIVRTSEPSSLRLFDVVIDPNILYLLFLIGLVGIILELVHPGVVAPGAIGTISLVTAILGFREVDVSAFGITLIVVGVLLFGAEALLPTHGVLGVCGGAGVIVGGSLLFQHSDGGGVSWIVLLASAAILAALFTLVVSKAVIARRAPVTTGPANLLGSRGVVTSVLDPQGQIRVRGELWRAEIAESAGAEPILVGRAVVVDSRSGLLLRVRAATVDDDSSIARTNREPDAAAAAT